MPNPENLIKHQFKSGDEWTGNSKGKAKGTKNRSTVIKELLEIVMQEESPLDENVEGEFTQEELMTLRMIKAAKSGDVKAYNALMDSAYGKAKQEITQTNIKAKPPTVRFTGDEPKDIEVEPDE